MMIYMVNIAVHDSFLIGFSVVSRFHRESKV